MARVFTSGAMVKVMMVHGKMEHCMVEVFSLGRTKIDTKDSSSLTRDTVRVLCTGQTVDLGQEHGMQGSSMEEDFTK